MTNHDVVIVGAGLAGLAAARRLREKGHEPVVFERSATSGGRVQTDIVDGFRLDRGFQILLTAYPEASRVLDLDALDLRRFEPGALIRLNDGFHRVSDPIRCPGDVFSSIKAPIGTPRDKLAVLRFRRQVRSYDIDELFNRRETTARARLEDVGFSSRMIETFLVPLFAAITLDPTLSFSSRYLEFIYSVLSLGDAAVPALGMGEIAKQLEANLPADTVQCSTEVEHVAKDHVIVDSSRVDAAAVIIATDAADASALSSDEIEDRGSAGVATWWLAAPEAPYRRPMIVLNGEAGLINHLAIMSQVSDQYSSDDRALIAASTPHFGASEQEMRSALVDWYGDVVSDWETVRVDRIKRALPAQPVGIDPHQSVRLASGLFVAGDHRQNASIDGALLSGRRAAEAVAARLCRDC